jgi:peptide/nickel transport system permease protein
MPLDYGTRYWSNPLHWADNPRAVPPTWINTFRSDKLLEQTELTINIPKQSYTSGAFFLKFYEKDHSLDRNRFPTFMTLRVSRVSYNERPPLISAYLARPDGDVIELYTFSVDRPLEGEEPPYLKYDIEPYRRLISGDPRLSRTISEYLLTKYDYVLSPSKITEIGYEKILFGDLNEEGGFEPLKGTYKIGAILRGRPEDSIDQVTFIIGGEVYGIMGTDTLGRDLSRGLLFGFPIALLIGFTTSILTTIIGSSLGIIGGYLGGYTDTTIQRLSDIVNNIPQLPLLIFLTFILGGNIWVVVAILIVFGWPSLVIVIRSMILSIKEASFVESAVAVGASKWRIMGRHIFPQVAPFILSQLIFFTPSAILSEAALSFLGLGDPTLPTWGQILEHGFRQGAVYSGYWWWTLPPGLLIVFSALAFVLISLGLEPIVNPRLRRRR